MRKVPFCGTSFYIRLFYTTLSHAMQHVHIQQSGPTTDHLWAILPKQATVATINHRS